MKRKNSPLNLPLFKGGAGLLFPVILLFYYFIPDVSAGSVTITRTSVTDSMGVSRSVFSSSEKINMRIESECSVSVAPSRIYYKFYIMNPSGLPVFCHEGNSTEGNAGPGASSLKNLPLSFYSGPGIYRFKAELVVGGVVAASDESKTFTVYSPVVTLTYPPNGVADLIDKPVTFRWVASGSSKYRVYVDDERSFYNPLWTGETSASSIQYPMNPSDERQKLSGGVEYYWKVQGLSSDGSVAARSAEPYGFTLKAETVVTSYKNIAVAEIEYGIMSAPPQKVNIRVQAANTGNQSETNIKIQLFIDGAASGDKLIASMMPNEKKEIVFEITDVIKETIIVTAMAAVADDSAKDNILTKTIEVPLPEEWRNVPKILGRVVDKETKNGIPGVTVKLDGPVSHKTITGSGGQYKFEKLINGQYKVKVEDSENFKGSEITVDIQTAKAYAENIIEIAATAPAPEAEKEAAGIAKGKVTKEDGEVIEGAQVRLLEKKKGDEDYEEVKKLLTDEKGYYKFADVLAGEYMLTFEKEGYDIVKENIKVAAGATVIKDAKMKEAEEEEKKEAVEEKKYTAAEAWEIIKGKLKDKKVKAELEGYGAQEFTVSEGDSNEAVSAIEAGKIKIKEAEVEIIK